MQARPNSANRFRRILVLCLLAFILDVHASITTKDACVQLTATWSENPSQITLHWPADVNATRYRIARKLLGANAWSPAATVAGHATNWSDTTISLGVAYEYQAIKDTGAGYTGYGYICTGLKRALSEYRGKVILLVTTELAAALPIELLRLEQDLVGDGWGVLRHTVATTQSVASVKQVIRADYNSDPANVKALFLFGHVPVPYSGNFSPDGHPDSIGAWPADVFYGDLNGVWTDTTVSNQVFRMVNVPGDGKFDQNVPPGPVQLQIGRVDLSNLTCFANKNPARYEVDLARQYLNKDHHWRHAKLAIERRALVYDRFYAGEEPEPQTATAYRHFPAFFGADQIRTLGANQYFPILATNSYLWTYSVSGGSPYGSDNIGTSDQFALETPQAIFTSFLGSYFAFWDQESDFLRAPLGASGSILTAIYSGQPQWLLHTMGLGEPIGYSAWITQNNQTNGLYPPHLNTGAGYVHIALMGDPTVRMHPVAPPEAVQGTVNGSGVHLTWSAAADPKVLGYTVYKSTSAAGPFAKVSGAHALTTLHFDDATGNSSSVYMVRALKLETSPSGSYFNLSQGVFFPDSLDTGAAPETPHALAATKITPGKVTVEWLGSSFGVRAYQVQRRSLAGGAFQTLGESPNSSLAFSDATVTPGSFAYRVKALGLSSDSTFSAEAIINLQPPRASLTRVDKTTQGNWLGRYGAEGYMVTAAGTNYPAYASITTSNILQVVYAWERPEPELLLWPDGHSHILSFWAGGQRGALGVSFRFQDSNLHRVAIYMADFQSGVRTGVAQMIDPFTGQIMTSLSYSNYAQGQYLVFDLQNYADLRLVPGTFDEGVSLSGIFFDVPILDPPYLTPASGNFLGETTVTMHAAAGATIRYTTNGLAPGADALTYTSPFLLERTTTIIARTVSGTVESGLTQINLTNTLVNAGAFVRVDTTLQGDWKNGFGQDGNWIPTRPEIAPTYGQLKLNGATPWLWSDNTTELRAVNKYAREVGRVASAWYMPSQLQVDLTLLADDLHPVSLYFLDWDGGGRDQDVILSDPSTGAIIDQRRVDNFTQGKHFVWNLKGKVRITINRVSGSNAILNGVFVGPAMPMNQTPPTFATASLFTGGVYTLQINGQAGQIFDLQSSADLRTWVDIDRKTISSTSAEFSVPVPSSAGHKFFRARLAQ